MNKYTFDRNTQMDYVNPKAELVIVGITPGISQTANDRKGKSKKQIKKENAFAGVMRNNLVKMLDHIKLNEFLGIQTCDSLWGSDFDRVEFTSLLKDAVFDNGKMFNAPLKLFSESILMEEFKKGFLKDCAIYTNAKLFIGLGKDTATILSNLKNEGVINAEVIGIPHASGANAGRIAVFLGEKKEIKDASYLWAQKSEEIAISSINKLMRS